MTPSLDVSLFHNSSRPAVRAMNQFVAREGHAHPPRGWCENGVDINAWAMARRSAHRKGELPPAQAAALSALPGWTWGPSDILEHYWSAGIAALDSFVAREGHAAVPKYHREDGHHLGAWVVNRRSEKRRGALSEAKAAILASYPGWTWGTGRQEVAAKWLDALVAYVNREGHAMVPVDHFEGKLGLGAWVGAQRTLHAAGEISPALKALLEQIPGWAWSAHPTWEEWMAALRAFVRREGHALVPDGHIEKGLLLGQWVLNRRRHYRTGDIKDAQRAELEAVPGWSWSVLGARWERHLALLVAYAAREGHTRVPEHHAEEGVTLGWWVGYMRGRHRAGKLSAERIAKLEAVPGWTWNLRAGDYAIAA